MTFELRDVHDLTLVAEKLRKQEEGPGLTRAEIKVGCVALRQFVKISEY